MLSYYACPTSLVSGIKIEWGAPALEQIVFLNLGSPKGVQLYDSNDFNCNPQGQTNIGTSCHYDNVGFADDAWELEFNCGPGGCAQGAALQWHGTLYTATADVLNTPSPTSPDQGPALNEFVYNDSSGLRAPPGWQPFTVTATVLLGPRCKYVAGAPLTFYAIVAAYGLSGTPSGTVVLLDGSTPLTTGILNGNGVVKFTTSLASGTHSLILAYQGSSKYAPSQSAADVLTSQDALPSGACSND
jgi:Bacterial Ig-like domain (group 3)